MVPKVIDLEIRHSEMGDLFLLAFEEVTYLMGTELTFDEHLVYPKRWNGDEEEIKEAFSPQDVEQLLKVHNYRKPCDCPNKQ